MIDAVLSYHLNPATCGVAKFNQQLAQKLGVPCLAFARQPVSYPLISIKTSEMTTKDLYEWWDTVHWYRQFDLFCHDRPHGLCADSVIAKANRIYAGNKTIADDLRNLYPDVIEAFCPSTLQGNPHRAALNVLTFGMAHKLQLPYYEKLKTLLDGSGQDYTVSVSTAVHEGSPWDAVAEAGEKLRAIFKDKTRVLGYLADDALAKELQDCSAVAMFFDPALRANNTTFWAAMEAGRVVVTNLDGDSPATHHGPLVMNIQEMDKWPTFSTLPASAYLALPDNRHPYTWDALLQTLGVSVNV